MVRRKKKKEKKKRIEILLIIIICIIIILFLSIFVHAPMEVDTTTPMEGDEIEVRCKSTVEDVRCVKARIDGVDCTTDITYGTMGWRKIFNIPTIQHSCTVPAKEEVVIECYVDETICYTTSESQNITIYPQLLITCDEGQYRYNSGCNQCGGVRLCEGADITYCGNTTDNICPAKYGANCINNDGCNDIDCTVCTTCGDCNDPACWP